MKKTISIMTISLLTATTLATASPSDQMNFTTLNQSDSHMLFGETNHNSIALGQDEMMKTEGEFFPIIFALAVGWGGRTYLNAPTTDGFVYQRWPYERRTYYRHSSYN